MDKLDPEKMVQIERLMRDNPEFRSLFEEHRLLDRQVESLASRPALSAEEEGDLKKLKKLKLEAKDKMSQILFADEVSHGN